MNKKVQANYEVEASASVSLSGEHTPFWLVSNRSGLVASRKNAGFVRGAIHTSGTFGKDWKWAGSIDLAGLWRSESSFLIKELYGELQYKDFALTIGSKPWNNRLVEQDLSSGDLLYSGNSLPLPEIRLSMPEYLTVPGFKGWFGFKAYFSFGMFTDQKWQSSHVGPDGKHYKDILFHSKGLQIKLGNAQKFPVIFEGGLEMAAQFGGTALVGDRVISRMPSGIKDIIKIIFPQGGGGDDLPGEQSNVLGNHVGEWSAKLTWNIKNNMILSAYYLHYFEDHSMMFLDYVWRDGLWGIEFTPPQNRYISKFVYEYLYTKDQAGPVYWDHTPEIPEQVSGTDNYYNHSIYGGWHHWGMGMGNPLIISPIWNKDNSLVFKCNRVIAHHFGIKGHPTSELSWRFLMSYTRGWGTYGTPYKEIMDNINFLGELSFTPNKFHGWSGTVGIGIDRGNILGPSAGIMFSLKKSDIAW